MLLYGKLAREGIQYLVTCTTYDHEPILLDHVDLMTQAIHPQISRAPFHLIAWAIMPDHVHLVIDPCGSKLSDIVDNIKVSFGWFYRIRTGHTGPVWELRFDEKLISDHGELKQQIDFVENNPVRHGLATDPRFYSHSSLHELIERGWTPPEPTQISTELAIAN